MHNLSFNVINGIDLLELQIIQDEYSKDLHVNIYFSLFPHKIYYNKHHDNRNVLSS